MIASLRAEIQMYESNMFELQGLNQVIRDEHQALQIAFAALEEKLRNSQVIVEVAKRKCFPFLPLENLLFSFPTLIL